MTDRPLWIVIVVSWCIAFVEYCLAVPANRMARMSTPRPNLKRCRRSSPIYLLTIQHWDQASIGFIMSIGGIAGILAQTPAGAMVDSTTAKRAVLVAASVIVTLGSLALPWMSNFAS